MVVRTWIKAKTTTTSMVYVRTRVASVLYTKSLHGYTNQYVLSTDFVLQTWYGYCSRLVVLMNWVVVLYSDMTAIAIVAISNQRCPVLIFLSAKKVGDENGLSCVSLPPHLCSLDQLQVGQNPGALAEGGFRV
jgi:hypothetical protein